MKPPVGLETYAELKRRVRLALNEGDARAQAAYEHEQVRAKWEAGKLIHEHILLNQNRAKYGQQVLKKLSRDLDISDRELRYMLEFVRTYPIWPSTAKLNWSQYRELLAVNDPEKREALSKKTRQKKWSQKELRQEIKKLRVSEQISVSSFTVEKEEPIAAKMGKLYTYQVVTAELGPWKGLPVIDLGFSNYYRPQGAFKFKAGEFVESKLDKSGSCVLNKVNSSVDQLFTYEAHIDEVTDGDTIWALINLGFGFTTKQCLRLRGIDCPEVQTSEGITAKKFIEKELKKAAPFLITSTKSDKYDRYLADLWVGEVYINRKLLDDGLAVRMDE